MNYLEEGDGVSSSPEKVWRVVSFNPTIQGLLILLANTLRSRSVSHKRYIRETEAIRGEGRDRGKRR